MRTMLCSGVAFAALMIPAAAFAQSTGTVEAEEGSEIVVTGNGGPVTISGVQIPDAPKARAVITQELIERRAPGQTILDTLNQVPGVSFTNSDAYGSSGGNIRIRGFDGNRIALTFDGIPLNDSGNYAIYSNQQLDPELIDQVNVNFGSTDVDSPTAAAAGGTINYRSLVPSDKLSATGVYSRGTNDMNRAFVLLQTGELTSFGTKAWVSASSQKYDQFRGPGTIYKQQYNGKIYQPLNDRGDFISVAAHYNQNRSYFYSNPSLANLRTVLSAATVPAAGSGASPVTIDLDRAQYDQVFDDRSSAFRYDYTCSLPSASATAGNNAVQDDRAACGNVYTTAYNPSNTGNVRLNSRYTISDKLLVSFDGAYSWTRANGGGSTIFAEQDAAAFNAAGTSNASGVNSYQYSRLGAGVATGVDLNGDGDLRDFVRAYFPSNTRTQRFTAIAGVRYQIDDNNLVRLAYTWDRARHRQTGEASLLRGDGRPLSPFSALDGEGPGAILDAQGNVLNKRNRLSYAILHQISGEYRGSFFEDSFKVAAGLRVPFFRRNLTNYCYTIGGQSNDAYCTSQTSAQVTALDTRLTSVTLGAPYANRIKTYDAILPNVGFTYDFTSAISMFGSYSKGLSVPRTDNLYGFDDVTISPVQAVEPEKTDSFDLGLRYTDRLIQAQVAGWYIKYKNRIISTTTLLEGNQTLSVDRNVGAVKSHGVDANIGIRPSRHFSLYGFGSYTIARLQEDARDPLTTAVILPTAGKFVVETPKWQYGGRAQFDFQPVSIGVQAKHTGDRWVTDVNDLKSAGYTLVDLDARIDLAFAGLDRTFLQLNVSNLLKERYFGNLTTAGNAFPLVANGSTGTPRFTFGAPRTFIGTIHFEF
ncbi:TonB-dependent receptor [Sphingomonas carotinifaciens]|uniref:Iron complex outermembrane recepter protein n=1 Tax=Sphingomonas carotinifaciens TaxID=1166323 RepID=A0A1G7FXM4_9SPHN|nr:TonB-dependent receptor [Sphingomonas carotinifaciens]MBB4086280.1 iron complex outermembrane receptor protein [Sphingomonas carotinifaciens]MWC42603.1 TonB-dependent receptor [Sphingomonas carotinifaciens]SDE80587.1 iron complex outermembrane recepter protein [Sphingomonas carotinifaciens]